MIRSNKAREIDRYWKQRGNEIDSLFAMPAGLRHPDRPVWNSGFGQPGYQWSMTSSDHERFEF
jgi:hypothetical protein